MAPPPLVVAGKEMGSEARERLTSKKKGPGLLRRIGSAVKSGLKKAVGRTARAVSGGSDKLAKRMGESYDQIAHLYESGLFSLKRLRTYSRLMKNLAVVTLRVAK